MVPILWLLVRNERKREKVVVSDKNRIGRPDEPVASPGLALADRSITAR